jgi:hypothetical protein
MKLHHIPALLSLLLLSPASAKLWDYVIVGSGA